MADILKGDDALKAQFERNILQRATQVLGAEQDPTLGQYIVMMLLDDYVNDDTIKAEVKQMTEGQLNEDFVTWCRLEMERVAKPSSGDNSSTQQDTEMADEYSVGSMPGRRKTEFKGRQDRSAFGGVGKSLKDRVGRNGVSRAFDTTSKDKEYSIKGKSSSQDSGVPAPGGGMMDVQQAMFATMQKALQQQVDQMSPQERFNHRCRNWPNCKYDNCKYVHPTEACEAFANGQCPLPKGLCLKVHVGQDIDDLANLPEQPKPFEWVPYQQYKPAVPKGYVLMPMMTPEGPKQVMVPVKRDIMECRFTDRCGNQQCPFGHPTPCNNDAKITDKMAWCEAKEECQDAECGKNHPSSSLVRENEPLPSKESTLEQCKFNQHCTNPRCRFRHAMSKTICRNGKDCVRVDCIFMHPLETPCKFGVNCMNQNCHFSHPDGRGTAERKFVNDEETEKLIPGQQQQEQEQQMDADTTME